MKSRRFTTKVEITHKSWMAQFLDMVPSTGRGGIDLISEEMGIELKCRYLKYIHHSYACCEKEYQKFPRRYPEQELYWAFLQYGLSKEPQEIDKRRINLESYTTERIIKVVPWNFVTNLSVSCPQRSGPFRYVRSSSLPSEEYFILFKEGKNKIYVPKDSRLEQIVRERMDTGKGKKTMIRYYGNIKVVTFVETNP